MKMKKIFAVALVATMTMASCLTAFAKTTTAPAAVVKTETKNTSVYNASAVEAGEKVVKIANLSVTSTIAGSYATESGLAVISPLKDLAAALSLADDMEAYIMAVDTDYESAPLAMAVVDAAATALGADVVSVITMDLCGKKNGLYYDLGMDTSVGVVMLEVKNADPTKTYSVVCVQPGGVVTVLPDVDDIPGAVTCELKAGLATYAIVAQ